MFSFMRPKSTMVLVLLASFALFSVVNGQTITGSISGVITDSTGSVVPGATVTLLSEKTRQARTVITGGEGRFSFPALQPGAYSLKVEQQGFQSLEQRGIILSANENLALGDLKVGQRVHVRGTPVGSMVMASEVTLQDENERD